MQHHWTTHDLRVSCRVPAFKRTWLTSARIASRLRKVAMSSPDSELHSGSGCCQPACTIIEHLGMYGGGIVIMTIIITI